MTYKVNNSSKQVIQDFGNEWVKYNYSKINKKFLYKNFIQYFQIFPLKSLNKNMEGFDMGCGTGRWAQFIAPYVKKLNCIDPSEAINVAQKNLSLYKNIKFFKETTDQCSIKENSQDFGYCLGVLHHIPNTRLGIKDCAKLLKVGAPLLLYIYYNFENRSDSYRLIWKISNYFRKAISILPQSAKHLICDVIALFVYLPLAKISKYLEKIGFNIESIPLSHYRDKNFYQMKNDSLDRFGTRLEKRFSKEEIIDMLIDAGMEKIIFSQNDPYWVCLSYKKT